jgi:hypothetical protein
MRARPEPQGEGAAQTSNGEVVSSESPDLIRARHRARRHQGQALRVVALRPTLTAPARGAGWKPGRDGGAVTSDRTKELHEGKKERLELDAGDRITEGTVTRMCRDPPSSCRSPATGEPIGGTRARGLFWPRGRARPRPAGRGAPNPIAHRPRGDSQLGPQDARPSFQFASRPLCAKPTGARGRFFAAVRWAKDQE